MKRSSIVTIALIMAFILVACGGESDSGSDTVNEETIPTPTQEIIQEDVPEDTQVEQEQPTDTPTDVPAQEVQPTPVPPTPIPPTDVPETDAGAQTIAYVGEAWTQLPLTDVRTGETFTFADFAGRTVFVHPMATWCTNCRANQRSLNANVVPQVSADDVVFVSLGIEPWEDMGALAQYAENEGFNWTFAVVTQEMFTELINVFGNSVSYPPSQPHFIVNPDGTHSPLLTGGVNPTDLVARLQQG